MSTIIKSFGQKTPKQVDEIGMTATITWPKMKEYIGLAIGKARNEVIEGIVVDETGITVKLSVINSSPLPSASSAGHGTQQQLSNHNTAETKP